MKHTSKLIILLAIVLTALAPHPQVHAQQPQPFTKADLLEQIRRNTMPDGTARPVALLAMAGSGVRGDDTEALRKQVENGIGEQRPDIASLIGVYAIPMTGKAKSENSFFSDVFTSTWRQVFGMSPQDMPVSPQDALSLAAKAGAKSFFVVANSGGENAAREFIKQMLAATGGRLNFACINCAVTPEMKKLILDANPDNRVFEWVPDVVTAFQQPGKNVLPLPGKNAPVINFPHVLLGNLLKTPVLIPKLLAQLITGSPHHGLYSTENIKKILSDDFGMATAAESALDDELTRKALEQEPEPPVGSVLPPSPAQYDTGNGPPTPNGGGAAAIAPIDLGGIDFSHVELRYLLEGNTDEGGLLAAAVRGTPAGQEATAAPGSGSDLAWSSFLVWLSLPDDTFWVNLNPNEPDRIIDAELGQTNVGRIMLEGDLQLKKDTAQLTDPRTDSGKLFWSELANCAPSDQGSDAARSSQLELSQRTWIVPGDVTVYADDNQIYVLDAPLDVKLESEHAEVTGGDNAAQTSEFQQCGEALLKRLVLPKLIENVNTASQYDELREVFYSRVVAEWYKDQRQRQDAFLGDLIDKGNVGALPSQPGWTPQATYNRYLKCIEPDETEHECGYNVTVETQTQEGNITRLEQHQYISGGIDLTSIPLKQVSLTELASEKPDAADQVSDAILWGIHQDPDDYWAGGAVLLAAASADSANAAVAAPVDKSAATERTGHSSHLGLWLFGLGGSAVVLALAGGCWLLFWRSGRDDEDPELYE